MERLARLSSDDRENLAAYLDGELDDESTRRIESILAGSAVARKDVETLARTYELLDELPRPTASADFAEKTVATAKLEGYKRPVSQQPWFQLARRGTILAAWSIALVGAAAAGFTLSNQWLPQEDDLLIENLPVIQNLDVYTEIGDLNFLEQLRLQEDLLEDIRARAGRDSQ